MSTVRSYRDLIAWQRSMDLVDEVYRLSSLFPPEERFGLVPQVRRAAVSIPSNVAEGYGRGSKADYVRFLRSARGSLYEVETQMLIAVRQGYVTQQVVLVVQQLLEECGRILAGLIRSLTKEDGIRAGHASPDA